MYVSDRSSMDGVVISLLHSCDSRFLEFSESFVLKNEKRLDLGDSSLCTTLGYDGTLSRTFRAELSPSSKAA